MQSICSAFLFSGDVGGFRLRTGAVASPIERDLSAILLLFRLDGLCVVRGIQPFCDMF